MKTTTLYTLGYEGLDVMAFIARLQEVGVETVVDVRQLPLSRKKGFSKTALGKHLAAAGIAYFHLPAVGCPKEVRDAYRSDGDWARYTRGFMKHLSGQDAPLHGLAELARGSIACLVCYEADFSACHRTYVGRAAQRIGGLQLKHLTAGSVFMDRPL